MTSVRQFASKKNTDEWTPTEIEAATKYRLENCPDAVQEIVDIIETGFSKCQKLKYLHNQETQADALGYLNQHAGIFKSNFGVDDFSFIANFANKTLRVDQCRTSKLSHMQQPAVADVLAGAGLSETARKFGVTKQNVASWVKASSISSK